MTHLFVLENVKVAERWDDSAHIAVQKLDDLSAELTLRVVGIALHEEHDLMLLDEFGKTLLHRFADAAGWHFSCKGRRISLLHGADGGG